MLSTKSTNNSELKEILSSGRLSLLINLVNGLIITMFKDVLFSSPGIFILIPGFIQLRGSIYSILTSKISSEIALGKIKIHNKKINNHKRIIHNLVKINTTSIVISTLLGITSFLFLRFLLSINYPKIILISFLGSIISSIILSTFVYILIVYAIQKGLDLDIISGPIITSVGDLIGTLCLFITVLLI